MPGEPGGGAGVGGGLVAESAGPASELEADGVVDAGQGVENRRWASGQEGPGVVAADMGDLPVWADRPRAGAVQGGGPSRWEDERPGGRAARAAAVAARRAARRPQPAAWRRAGLNQL